MGDINGVFRQLKRRPDETAARVRLRQDGCRFCSSRGVKSASDPNGRLVLVSQRKLVRYRFGHKTADFLICPACGTYVATQIIGPRGLFGVVNVVGLAIPELQHAAATLASLDDEDVAERIHAHPAPALVLDADDAS